MYIYSFNYDNFQTDLAQLEARAIFNTEIKNKYLISEKKVEPSNSAFIKKRFDILLSSTDYDTLISDIQTLDIQVEGFKVEYLFLDEDKTGYRDSLSRLKDVGYCITGVPDYQNPTITYSLCNADGVWYFGELHKNTFEWHKHKQKPKSYSSSILPSIAKTLINVVSKGNSTKTIIDACCGVGTVLLEACYAGYTISGCEINWKISNDAKENIKHFDYSAEIYTCDINELNGQYDASIIDLPYNISCNATREDMLNIIGSAAKLSTRMAIVSNTNISDIITEVGFQVEDYCRIGKKGRSNFAREVWVCSTKN